MICKNCGKEIKPNANFCPYCGTKVDDDAAVKDEKEIEEVSVEDPAGAETPVETESSDNNTPTEEPVPEDVIPSADEPVEVTPSEEEPVKEVAEEKPEEILETENSEKEAPSETTEEEISTRETPTDSVPAKSKAALKVASAFNANDFAQLKKFLLDPFCSDGLPIIPAICMLVIAPFALGWMIMCLFTGMMNPLFNVYSLSQYVKFGPFLTLGIILTAYTFVILMILSFLDGKKEEENGWKEAFMETGGYLVTPTLFSVIGALFAGISGTLALFAAMIPLCTKVTLLTTKTTKMNSYVRILVVSGYLFVGTLIAFGYIVNRIG